MTTFAERNWNERETVLGDPAETAFTNWAADTGLPVVRYGLERPPISLVNVPPFIRYTPDFLTAESLIEVQGCGQDQTFKFKHDKLWALVAWDEHTEVCLWLWNQPQNTGHMIALTDLWQYLYNGTGTLRADGMFDGHKPYVAVTWLQLTGGRWDVT